MWRTKQISFQAPEFVASVESQQCPGITRKCVEDTVFEQFVVGFVRGILAVHAKHMGPHRIR